MTKAHPALSDEQAPIRAEQQMLQSSEKVHVCPRKETVPRVYGAVPPPDVLLRPLSPDAQEKTRSAEVAFPEPEDFALLEDELFEQQFESELFG